MKSKSIYLAGPISGLEHHETVLWRETLTEELAKHEIQCISPMRNKNYLIGTGKIAAYGYGHTLSTDKAIVTRDRFDLLRSDLIVVNLLGAERVSIGTMVELGWADAHGKPVLLIIEPEDSENKNIHEHAFVRELCGWRVSTVEEARKIIIAILT